MSKVQKAINNINNTEVQFIPLTDYQKHAFFKHVILVHEEFTHEVSEFKKDEKTNMVIPVKKKAYRKLWRVGADAPFFEIPEANAKNYQLVYNETEKRFYPVENSLFKANYTVKTVKKENEKPKK